MKELLSLAVVFLLGVILVFAMESCDNLDARVLEIQQQNDSLSQVILNMEAEFDRIDSLQNDMYGFSYRTIDSLKNLIAFKDNEVNYMLHHIDSSLIANSDSVCERLQRNIDALKSILE